MTEPSTLRNPLPDRPRLVFRVGFAGNHVTRSREVVVNNPDRSTSGRETRKIAGVIFDMDGVLVDSEPFIAEAAVRMFAEKGVAVRPEDFRPFIGMGEDRFLGGVAEARSVVLDLPRDKVRTYEIYLELIRGRLEPLPGVADFIGRCRSLGLRLAVASSADRMKVEGNLRQLGLPSGTFDAVVVGEDIIRKKPAPERRTHLRRLLDIFAPQSVC